MNEPLLIRREVAIGEYSEAPDSSTAAVRHQLHIKVVYIQQHGSTRLFDE